MIPIPQFLCPLNPTCPRYLKRHAPEIPVDPNFQAAVLPKFCSGHDCKFFLEGKFNVDCDRSGTKLEMMLIAIEVERSWKHETTQTAVRVEIKYPTV